MIGTQRLRLTATLMVAAGFLAACAPTAGEDASSVPSSPAPPAPTAEISVPSAPATLEAPQPAPPSPVQLVIGDLAVDMPVTPVGVTSDGSMEVPDDPFVAGWYRFGAAPGSAEGATVIAAHVDSVDDGLGPLAWLRDAQAGTSIQVVTGDGTVTTYSVQTVQYIPRAQLPVGELFARTGPRSLVLITCGGEFDAATSSYSDNVVLIASAVT